MQYRLRSTGEVVAQYQLAAKFPNVSIPTELSSDALEFLGLDEVQDAPAPTVTELQVAEVSGATKDASGKYVVSYTVKDRFANISGGKTKAEQEAEYLAQIAKQRVPMSIQPYQARLELLARGILDEVQTMVTDNQEHAIVWEFATEIRRDSQILQAIAAIAGYSDAQVDEMFISASKR
jgi:hypothetical protein